MKELFDEVAIKCSKLTTRAYSTSFSLGIRCLDKSLRDPICAIYGFVRFADEIVDTFHDYDKESLLTRFKEDTYRSIEEGISLNPILHSFQQTVNDFNIDHELIDQFLYSMEMDLDDINYDQQNYETYILGSAEVVGLMCLKVFCDGDQESYLELKPYAMKLGSAFQKVNFLRDLKADFEELNRSYFPNANLASLDEATKSRIIQEIEEDFKAGYQGIMQLPADAKFGVFMAYRYYKRLLKKLKGTPAGEVKSTRIRVPNYEKVGLLTRSYVKYQLNLVR